MEQEFKQALLGSVNALITQADAHDLYDALTAAIPLAQRVSIRLTDGGAVVNPLLHLRMKDEAAYNRVLDLVDQRRQAMGYDPLQPAEPTGYNRVEYMREFMENKRVRQRMAVDIENLLRPERDRLIGNNRMEFMRQQSLKWKEALDSALIRAKERGPLTKPQLREIRDRFWATIDKQLEERQEIARIESLKPAGQRSGVPPLPLDALIEAIVDDPYKK